MKTTIRKELEKMRDPECDGPVTCLAFEVIRWQALANVLERVFIPRAVRPSEYMDMEFDTDGQ